MEINIKYNKILILIILTMIFFINFSGCINEINKTKKNVLIFATFNNEFVHPFGNSAFATIGCNIYDGLVEFNETFQIMPSLAISWNNPDNLTWIFNLRENVKFHNNYNFTAEDVNYTIKNIYSGYKSIIDRVIVVNSQTIEIKTIKPYFSFLQELAWNFKVFSKKYSEEADSNWSVGTGPYKLKEYVEGNYTTLERFDNYWGEKPEIQTVTFKLIENNQERLDNLITGKLDVIDYNVDEKFDNLSQIEGIKIVKYPPLATYLIGFDLRENGSYGFPDGQNPTADIRVRKAIYHAIDIEPLIKGPFKGLAIPASQLLTPYIFGYNPNISRLSYDIDLAKQLLTEAGYENGFDIEMDIITHLYEYNLENCRLIAEQLSKVGINLSLNKLSTDEFNKKVVIEKNTSMWLVGWGSISADGGIFYDLFIRSKGDGYNGFYNSGYYSNPVVDSLAEEASIEMKSEKRAKLLKEGFKIALVDDVILVPLFSQELFVLTTEDVLMQPRADSWIVVKDIRFK